MHDIADVFNLFRGTVPADKSKNATPLLQVRQITAAAPCAPVLPLSQREIHTRGDIWSFNVG